MSAAASISSRPARTCRSSRSACSGCTISRRGNGAAGTAIASSQLVFVAMSGGCRVHLDDARVKESVTLDDPARALYVGTWVWHELTDFAAGAAILVIASTLYEDAEYLRDYDAFKREAASRS